jgi:hypothetical protein
MSGAISVLMFLLVRQFILNASDPVARGFFCLPVAYGVTIFINVFSVLLDGPPRESSTACLASISVGALVPDVTEH